MYGLKPYLLGYERLIIGLIIGLFIVLFIAHVRAHIGNLTIMRAMTPKNLVV